jgi:hypothetical protein
VFYSCFISDCDWFVNQLTLEFAKCPAVALSFDYMPIPRELLVPLVAAPSLDLLSLRGNRCLTPYDYVTHSRRPFPQFLNAFFNALATSTIKVLNLYACRIGDDGAIGLASTLFFNTSLLCISLTGNRIADAGAIALSNALSYYVLDEQETAVVEKLVDDESKQKFSDEGGSLLKKRKGQKTPPPKKPAGKPAKKSGQTKHPAERTISFDPSSLVTPVVLGKWRTCVTLESGQQAVPGNATLTSLILDDNVIGQNGGMALREMLTKNTRIVQFSVANNPDIPHEIAEALARRGPIADLP